MTQDERWIANWKAVMDFMKVNKRRPSKFVDEERAQKLVETSAEADECWGDEAGETSTIQPIVGIRREV